MSEKVNSSQGTNGDSTLIRLFVAFQSSYNGSNVVVYCVTALCLSPGPADNSNMLTKLSSSFRRRCQLFLSVEIRNRLTKSSTKSSVQVFGILRGHSDAIGSTRVSYEAAGRVSEAVLSSFQDGVYSENAGASNSVQLVLNKTVQILLWWVGGLSRWMSRSLNHKLSLSMTQVQFFDIYRFSFLLRSRIKWWGLLQDSEWMNEWSSLTISDLTSQEPVKTEEGREMAGRIGAFGYLECSAKTKDGVREVFEMATRAALQVRKRKKRGPCTLLWAGQTP